jgi:hypothetical protein
MIFLRILVAVAGLGLTLWTVLSAVRTVILPRSVQSSLSRLVFRSVRKVFNGLAAIRPSFEWRDGMMAHFAPIGMLTLVAAWLALVTVGFMGVFWAVEQQGWADAFWESGSSLLTLGFAPVDGTALRALAFVEAALGLGLLALLITYLPTLYGAFSRRETLVALLETRAGTPPSAVEMLIRFQRIGLTDRLDDMWGDWEVWFAQIEESHTSYPALTFFRSPQADRHWVTAAGTVLDAASLTLSSLDVVSQPQAALAIRSGYLALRRIAEFFGIEFDSDPEPTDPISIRRGEFDDACDRLAAAGLPLLTDRDQAWRDFAGWRVNYDTVLLALAETTMAPYAPWTSDRSTADHRPPRVRRWGRRRPSGLGLE